jgi:hypothetical protein
LRKKAVRRRRTRRRRRRRTTRRISEDFARGGYNATSEIFRPSTVPPTWHLPIQIIL